MSWNIKHVGPKAAVRLAVQNEPYLMDSLKNAVFELIDSAEGYDGAIVESSGHFPGGQLTKLEVRLVALAKLPEPVAAPAAAAGDSVAVDAPAATPTTPPAAP